MNRNLRTLGLALAAAFALSAATASAASAQTQGMLTTDGTGVTLDMTETGGGGTNLITVFGSKIECPGIAYVAHQVGSAGGVIPNKAQAFTVTPTFSKCLGLRGSLEYSITITMNGCDYVYNIGTTVAADTYSTTVDIVCPVGKAIEIDWFLSEKHAMSICTDVVNPQKATGPHVTSITKDDTVGIAGSVTVKALESGPLCATAETNEAKFDIDVIAQGTNATGAPTGITVTD